MSKRRTTQELVTTSLSPEEAKKGVRRFRNLLELLQAFEPANLRSQDDPTITEIASAARSALENTFPPGTVRNRQFAKLGTLEFSYPMYAGRPTPAHELIEGLQRAKADSIVLVRQAIRDLEDDIGDSPAVAVPASEPTELSRSAFVVHGRDGAEEAVARLLEKLGLDAVILHEQPGRGRTIIEKVEQHSDVRFAVVILTPDDFGGIVGDDPHPRARQNVILELGYFIGKLGRHNVCALKKNEVEIPSDLSGFEYVDLDDAGAWKRKLAKELLAAGIEIDVRKLAQL